MTERNYSGKSKKALALIVMLAASLILAANAVSAAPAGRSDGGSGGTSSVDPGGSGGGTSSVDPGGSGGGGGTSSVDPGGSGGGTSSVDPGGSGGATSGTINFDWDNKTRSHKYDSFSEEYGATEAATAVTLNDVTIPDEGSIVVYLPEGKTKISSEVLKEIAANHKDQPLTVIGENYWVSLEAGSISVDSNAAAYDFGLSVNEDDITLKFWEASGDSQGVAVHLNGSLPGKATVVLNLKWGRDSKDYKVYSFDKNGKLAQQGKASSDSQGIVVLSGLAGGDYFLSEK